MKIGIIGAGNIGATLTRLLTGLGHQVAVANSRDPGSLADLAAETGANAVAARDAAAGAEVVVVTIPQGRIPDLPDGILDDAAEGATVVDTGNYYPQRDGPIAAIEEGQPESRWVETKLGHPVVKAFNCIYAQDLLNQGRPAGAAGRRALPVAGDDPRGKAAVMALIDEMGFDPVDAGGLDESWRQQPGTPIYTVELDADGVRQALTAASPERTAEWRA